METYSCEQEVIMNYYVYAHIDKGEIVYIGKGRYERAWRSCGRSEDHKGWMKSQLPFLNVVILNHSLEEQEALDEEKELIKKYSPKYNKFYTEEDTEKRRKHGKELSKKSIFKDSEVQSEFGKRSAKSNNHPNNRLGKCKHCGVEMNLGHIARYHNDNCKRVRANDSN